MTTGHFKEECKLFLKDKLEEQYQKFIDNAPQNIKDTMNKAAAELAEKKLEEVALKEGDMFPNFSLQNAIGKVVELKDLLADGHLVVSFYRGGW